MDDIRMAGGKYMQVPINEKTLVTELSGDFTLPDYQPEIKRLLQQNIPVQMKRKSWDQKKKWIRSSHSFSRQNTR